MELLLLAIFGLVTLFAVIFGTVYWLTHQKISFEDSKSKIDETFDERDHLRIRGFEVYYHRQGSGTPLVFLHGIGASSYTWRYQIDELAKSHQVIAIDIPGFGKSSKNKDEIYSLDAQAHRIIEFLDQLKLGTFDLVGSSMGATIAMNIALLYPDRVTRLGLLAPALFPRLPLLNLPQLSWSSALLKPFVTEFAIGRIMTYVNARKENVNPVTVKAYARPYLKSRAAIKTFIKSIECIRDPEVPKKFFSLKQPMLILHGEKDKIISFKKIKKLSTHWGQAKLFSHKEAGHHLQEDEPEWCNSSLKQFFS